MKPLRPHATERPDPAAGRGTSRETLRREEARHRRRDPPRRLKLDCSTPWDVDPRVVDSDLLPSDYWLG